jgi:hypothetical protein
MVKVIETIFLGPADICCNPLVVWMRDLLGVSDDLEGGRQRV